MTLDDKKTLSVREKCFMSLEIASWLDAQGSSCVLFSAGQVAAEVTAVEKKQADTTKMMLKVSPDGKSLVDQDGKEVARFAEGLQVVPDKSGDNKMPGCMC